MNERGEASVVATLEAQHLAISARGLTKAFEAGGSTVMALNGVDLDACYGELTMLVGPSGCGKTTLLCLIAGLLNQTAGEIEVLGQAISHRPERERIRFRRDNLGFVFQQFNLLPALTAAENVAVPLLVQGVARKTAVKRAIELLGSLGMGERVHALPRQLSGGQQQRVALARAVIHEPRLIVCDEPTSALDAETGHRVMELLREVSVAPERAVIVVTHDSRIFGFADAVARMDDGRMLEIARGQKAISQMLHHH